jgi:hypothetical protein
MRRNLGRPRAHSRSVRVGVPWRLAGDPLITGQYAPRRRRRPKSRPPYRLGVRVADDIVLSRISFIDRDGTNVPWKVTKR